MTNKELRQLLETTAVRFELMAGRFRGCDETGKQHALSIWECEGFAADYRALANATPAKAHLSDSQTKTSPSPELLAE
jgi:hypothetical protein